MTRLLKKLVFSALLATTLMATGAGVKIAVGQETDDPVKIQIYQRFYDNRERNKSVAYQAARDYLAKYTKDKDQYVDFLQKWIKVYEQDERKRKLPGLINEKNF